MSKHSGHLPASRAFPAPATQKRSEIGLTEVLDLAFCPIFRPKKRNLLVIWPVNLQPSSSVNRFRSRVLRQWSTAAHHWGQMLMFEGKNGPHFRAFTIDLVNCKLPPARNVFTGACRIIHHLQWQYQVP